MLAPVETVWGRTGSFLIPFVITFIPVSYCLALVSLCVFSSGIAVSVTKPQRRKGLAAVLSRASESIYIAKYLFLT